MSAVSCLLSISAMVGIITWSSEAVQKNTALVGCGAEAEARELCHLGRTQVFAYTGQVNHALDAMLCQVIFVPDAGELEKLRSPKRACPS